MSDTKPEDAESNTNNDTAVTTNTNQENDDADVSKKLEKELGRRPSIAELEIKSIVQDPKVSVSVSVSVAFIQ